jgi:HrpA-like RNA helicase
MVYLQYMMSPEGEQPYHPPLDSEYLKSLAYEQLAGVLLDEAQTAVSLSPGPNLGVKKQLIRITEIPSLEEQAQRKEFSEMMDEAMGIHDASLYHFLVGDEPHIELDSEEAREELDRLNVTRALEKIENAKEEIITALDGRPTPEEVEIRTKDSLLKISAAAGKADIYPALEYVRNAALAMLQNPARRGIVLANNALNGDKRAYSPSVVALQESVTGELQPDWTESCEALEVITQLISFKKQEPLEWPRLRNLAVDMLARLRTWTGTSPHQPKYNSTYAIIAAQLSVTFRDLEK